MIKEYTISNFKAFSTPATLPIKPITLIYGANSAGKSSIFQSLILLRDSYEGYYPNALPIEDNISAVARFVHNDNLSKNISFFIKFDIDELKSLNKYYKFDSKLKKIIDYLIASYITIGVENVFSFNTNNVLFSKELSFYIGNEDYPFITYFSCKNETSNFKNIRINRSHSFWDYYWNFFGKDTSLHLFNELLNWVKNDINFLESNKINFNKFLPMIIQCIDNKSKILSENEIADFFESYFLDCRINQNLDLMDCFEWVKSGFKSGYKYKDNNSIYFSDGMVNSNYAFMFNEYLPRDINELFKCFSSEKMKERYHGNFIVLGLIFLECVESCLHGSLKYIGPYRKFLKNTSEIDCKHFDKDYVDKHGEHFSTILINNKNLLDDFNFYLEKLKFEYKMSFNQTSRNEEDGSTDHDIVVTHNKTKIRTYFKDVGYGLSQAFPVIAQCIVSNNDVIAIEQPELHLHPALQAELGDLFIDSAMQKKNTLLLETHSEHILLRIMRRIRETTNGTLPEGVTPIRAEDVSVVYVESVETDGDRHSIIREMPLNDQGELVKAWPGGFFEEGLREVF